MAAKRYKTRLWFVPPLVGIIFVILLMIFNCAALGLGLFGFIGLVVVARLWMDYMQVRAMRMMKEERRAIRGAKAEEKIGALLVGLGKITW